MERHFDQDLQVLKERLLYMGSLAETMIHIAVKTLVDSVESEGRDVVAVEAAGPEPVLIALVQGLSVPVLRPVFRRDGGRVVVVGKDAGGRDIFDVERYERLDVEMRPAIVGKPLNAA